MTVTGEIDASQLGVVLTHEHIFANLLQEYRRDGLLSDPALAIHELQFLKRAGGSTIVDVTTSEIGPNPAGLRKVSEATGIKIVMGVGHYREPYLDKEWFDRTSVDAIADLIVHDIVEGVGDTGIRGGIIGEIGADKWYVSALEERSFRAAARAHRRTGLTITTHAARWPVGRAQVDLLMDEGVDPRRIIVGHSDTVPDPAYHEELARRGCFVEFDTIRGSMGSWDLERITGYVMALLERGLGDRILLSHDTFLRSQLHVNGGSGYDYILTSFVPRLRNAGLGDSEIQMLMVDNPRRALTGETT
jgi:phosphotriesterase-related protein